MNRAKIVLLGGAILVLLGSGLSYGARVPWAAALVAVTIGLLLLLWVLFSGLGVAVAEAKTTGLVWHGIAFGALIAWIVVQIYLPVPFDLAHPGWRVAGELTPGMQSGLISVDPNRGFEALIRLLCYAGLFWLIVQTTRDATRAALILNAICCIGGALALIGLIDHLDGPRILPWMPDQSHAVRGPFVNRNHFATYCGLTIIVAFGLLISIQDKARRRSVPGISAWQIFGQGVVNGGWFHLSIIIILVMALVLSGSRAGLAATVAGVFALVALNYLAAGKGRRGQGFVIPVVLVLALGTFAWAGDFLVSRLITEDLAANGRFLAYRDVAKAIPDFPLTGVGYGAFAQAFPIYRGEDIAKLRFYLENTYLEVIFELGLPMAVVWYGLLASLLYRCFKGAFERKRDRIYPMIAAAAGTLAAAHSMFDYSLQVPAVALLFVAILGTGVAQSWPSRKF